MDDYSKDVKIFKALCDEKRLAILNHLKSGEKCACVLIEYEYRTVRFILSHENTLRVRAGSQQARRKMDTLQSQ
jgi:DNA-binding transcriptional ArsR family regulator